MSPTAISGGATKSGPNPVTGITVSSDIYGNLLAIARTNMDRI